MNNLYIKLNEYSIEFSKPNSDAYSICILENSNVTMATISGLKEVSGPGASVSINNVSMPAGFTTQIIIDIQKRLERLDKILIEEIKEHPTFRLFYKIFVGFPMYTDHVDVYT